MRNARRIIKENIKNLVDLEGGPKAFADKIGVSRQAVNNWINDSNIPDIERIAEIAHLYHLSLADMFSPFDGDIATPNSTESGFVEVPLYGSVAAGIPIEMIEDYEMKEVPRRFVDDDPDCFLVKAKGNSETGRGIFDGDYVLVSPKYNDPRLYPDELFLTTVNGDEATIKQVHILENGVELIPDSLDPTYRSQIYDFNEIDTPPVTTRGMVTWHCAPF